MPNEKQRTDLHERAEILEQKSAAARHTFEEALAVLGKARLEADNAEDELAVAEREVVAKEQKRIDAEAAEAAAQADNNTAQAAVGLLDPAWPQAVRDFVTDRASAASTTLDDARTKASTARQLSVEARQERDHKLQRRDEKAVKRGRAQVKFDEAKDLYDLNAQRSHQAWELAVA